MNVGILLIPLSTAGRIEEMTEWRTFAALAERYGDRVVLLRSDQIRANTRTVQALVPLRRNKRDHLPLFEPQSIPWPDVIWDRGRYQQGRRFEDYRLLRANMLAAQHLDHHAPRWMNGPFLNKWRMHRLIAADANCPFHTPDTIAFDHPEQTRALTTFLQQHPICYFKPVNGTGGRGMLRIEQRNSRYLLRGVTATRQPVSAQLQDRNQLLRWLSGWIRLPMNAVYRQRFLLQQAISTVRDSDQCVHDFRVLAQKNAQGSWQISGMGMRVGGPNQISSNLHQQGRALAVASDHVSLLHQTSLHIAEWIEQQAAIHPQCEFGIDLAVDPKGTAYLLEINPKPGRKLFRIIGDQHAVRQSYECPLAYARYVHEQR
jgi:hypothetical protein